MLAGLRGLRVLGFQGLGPCRVPGFRGSRVSGSRATKGLTVLGVPGFGWSRGKFGG